jgi:6-phosphofructokinase 1
MRSLAILTSGGDAPGMNAAIRAFTRYALNQGLRVFGVERGYEGLINNQIYEMGMRSVSDILQRGGTILKTARSDAFKKVEGQKTAYENLKARGVDGLCVIGGDGTFTGAKVFGDRFGFPVVGIPGTIDNDLAYTQYTLGFDTAVNTVLDAINKIRDTMTSHDRVCIVEVMGRNCGDIALYAGIAGGAEAILVPEIEYDVQQLATSIKENYEKGKTSDIIILAEGAGKAEELAIVLKALTKISTRSVVLGHVQRGGSPTLQDRLLGAKFGVRAVELLMQGKSAVVGVDDNVIIDMDIAKALAMKKVFDKKLYDIAVQLSK